VFAEAWAGRKSEACIDARPAPKPQAQLVSGYSLGMAEKTFFASALSRARLVNAARSWRRYSPLSGISRRNNPGYYIMQNSIQQGQKSKKIERNGETKQAKGNS
jgi:hypothetical protein